MPATRTVPTEALFDDHTGVVVICKDADERDVAEPFASVTASTNLTYPPASPTTGTYESVVAPAMSDHVVPSGEDCHFVDVTVIDPPEATHVGCVALKVEPTEAVPEMDAATVAVGPFGNVRVTTPLPSLTPCVCTMLP